MPPRYIRESFEAEAIAYILLHGMRNMQNAIAACGEGKANGQQQKLVFGLLEILALQ